MVPVVWGSKPPGPQTDRSKFEQTCPSDGLHTLFLQEELKSDGRVSKWLWKIGRRLLIPAFLANRS